MHPNRYAKLHEVGDNGKKALLKQDTYPSCQGNDYSNEVGGKDRSILVVGNCIIRRTAMAICHKVHDHRTVCCQALGLGTLRIGWTDCWVGLGRTLLSWYTDLQMTHFRGRWIVDFRDLNDIFKKRTSKVVESEILPVA